MIALVDPFDVRGWPCAVDATMDLMNGFIEPYLDGRRVIIDLHVSRLRENSQVADLLESGRVLVRRDLAGEHALVLEFQRANEEIELATIFIANDRPARKRR